MLFIITIWALFALAPEIVNGGYIYPRPNIPFQEAKIESNINEVQLKTISEFLPRLIPENVVSYSLPSQSYQQNNNVLNINNINPNKVNSDLNVLSLPNQQNNLEINSVPHHDIPEVRIPPLKLITPLRDQANNVAAINEQNLNIPVANNIPINQNNDFISDTYSHVVNPSISTVNVPLPFNKQNLEGNTVQHSTDIIANSIPNSNLVTATNLHNDLVLNNVQNVDIPSLNVQSENVPASALLQNNLEFTTQLNTIELNNNGYLNTPNIQGTVSPIITKHVYFHAPPPEIEEPPVQILPPKTKNVKIIVIKVPPQENINNGLLQSNAINQLAPIEEKTIIYVLSKKPSTPQVFVPKSVPSEHEVFFVKYNGGVDSAVTPINNNLEQIYS